MKRKLLALVLVLCMAAGLCACKGAKKNEGTEQMEEESQEEAKPLGNQIYVMTAAPDHGWTGQGAAYAAAFVDEINLGIHGDYAATHYIADNGEAQNEQVQEILANNDAAGVMFWGCDESAKEGQQALIDAGIPWISYDRIVEGTMNQAILNYSGDNWQSGAAAAYYLVTHGMDPESTLVQFSGDASTVSQRRTEGFRKFLLGQEHYYDAEGDKTYTIEDVNQGKAWTQEEVDKLCTENYFEYNCEWSNEKAKGYIESNLSSWIEASKSTDNTMFVFSMDDEMSLAFLELLSGDAIDEDVKGELEALTVYMSAVGGMEEMYAVLRGDDEELSAAANTYFEGLMSVYYNPVMTQTAIRKLLDYLDGTWDYVLGAEDYEPVFIVDSGNVNQYEGFLGR
ncbi:MAG: sugar ABC transporter substrate-binding protein [Lachnospiraceae bacterium]|jgi:ribose transport system substrate-binding protein|nr:sugar ABC transporter substrate-binding protein [Lachnospiraceae bacterium]